jgi:hypothetical protein
MSQVDLNLLHSLKFSRKEKEYIPFVYGLRTGFLRAWLFVAFKVIFIVSFMHGSGIINSIENNVGLLDRLIRNDFNYINTSGNLAIRTSNEKKGLVESASDGNKAAEQASKIEGKIILESGSTSKRITFQNRYLKIPKILVSPRSRVGSEFWISDESSTGFTLNIAKKASADLTFDWYAIVFSDNTQLRQIDRVTP